MYIPYEAIGTWINKLFNNKQIEELFNNKKIEQNINFIKRNKKKVLKKLRLKFINKQKINVVFYLYDESKWKCQSLYDLLNSDEMFNVKIIVTRNSVTNTKNPSYQKIEDLQNTYQKLLQKGLNVDIGYDIDNAKHYPFEKFDPDIIIYQHPWYVETSQGPVVCSKFALTYYVPYFVVNAGLKEDYYLRFHSYIEKHCVLNNNVYKHFSSRMKNKGENLLVTGHPQLDYFVLKKQIDYKDYVIYAPHWTLCSKGLAYGTFQWNGKYILDYAKDHTEINWVFKPHPLLRKALKDTGFMQDKEIEDYYNQWDQIGIKCETSDYMELFSSSKCMITDSGSFLTEYFLTKRPLIHIISDVEHEYCSHYKMITDNYYKVRNLEELEATLDEVIINNNDIMKEQREKAVEESDFYNIYSAQSIIDNIKKEVMN